MLLYLSVLFWIIIDPIGNVAPFVGCIGNLSPKRQSYIIAREMLIALAVMILALFFGQEFFALLQVDSSALAITGGIILFLVAVGMIFSEPQSEQKLKKQQEPLIVPLAVPFVAGPGILATIIFYAGSNTSTWVILGAIFLSWLFSLPILLFAPWIKYILGTNGATAVERIFGYLVVILAIQMISKGLIDSFSF
ncbi:MAG: MarC family protein [Verrucomicrobia bacterium]|nr:MarC family protein [Verrucomicrobiota bacterium]MBS0646891.1 MarC family protein [Verrucomicrobiota bacterium]